MGGASGNRNVVPRTASGKATHFRHGKASRGKIATRCQHCGQYGHAVTDPVLPGLRQVERQYCVAHLGRNQRAIMHAIQMVDHADICIRAEAKGQYGVGVLLSCRAQTPIMHIVGRQYRRAAFDQAFEDFGLGVGNTAFVLEKFDMCRCNGGDDGNIGPDDMAKRAHFASVVHAHFENAEVAIRGHPRKA